MLKKGEIQPFDTRRNLFIGTHEEAIRFAAIHWIHTGQRAIQRNGRFTVALSGGSSPKAVFEHICKEHIKDLDWTKVYLFWSDERAVPPTSSESNYKMAMDSGFSSLPIPAHQIFRMKGEENIEKNAKDYEDLIHKHVGSHLFDLVMLGVGEDGHTASLFPNTIALQEKSRLVVANFIPEKNCWRMTFTYPCIQKSRLSVIYCLGKSKESIVPLVLNAPIDSSFPASAIGTTDAKALWILDSDAARLLS